MLYMKKSIIALSLILVVLLAFVGCDNSSPSETSPDVTPPTTSPVNPDSPVPPTNSATPVPPTNPDVTPPTTPDLPVPAYDMITAEEKTGTPPDSADYKDMEIHIPAIKGMLDVDIQTAVNGYMFDITLGYYEANYKDSAPYYHSVPSVSTLTGNLLSLYFDTEYAAAGMPTINFERRGHAIDLATGLPLALTDFISVDDAKSKIRSGQAEAIPMAPEAVNAYTADEWADMVSNEDTTFYIAEDGRLSLIFPLPHALGGFIEWTMTY